MPRQVLRGLLAMFIASAPLCAQTVNYTYDAAGRVVKADYGGGVVFVYNYDAAGRLISRQSLSSMAPLLTITGTHQGNFAQGQTNAHFTIAVSNTTGAAATSGTYTVSDTLPAGLTLESLQGTGWNCSGNACSRSDVLNQGANYPPITVAVNVANSAASPEINAVTLAIAGSTIATATDLTVITTSSPCAVTGDLQPSIADVQAVINMALGIVPSTSSVDFNGDGLVDIVDVQVLSNVVLGITSCPD